jgi:predicted alpha/beta-hydrolase family hydrolase
MRAERVSSVARLMTAFAMASVVLSATLAEASGHGPVFGAATPTLGKGGWAFDQAWMGQRMEGPADSGAILRSMISFGITEKVQISGSVPLPLGAGGKMLSGRMMAMMSGNRDFEALLGWRFQTRPVGQGARVESTVFIGALVPADARRGDVLTSPAGYVSVTSGYASRSHYFWVGASRQRNVARGGDRLGSVASYSLVYGFRPPAWRLEYPKPDLRLFVEAVGDTTERTRHHGQAMVDTGGRVLLVGPTVLLLYKAYGVEGGMLFPVSQRTNGIQPRERFRFGVNFAYFFWPGKGKGH